MTIKTARRVLFVALVLLAPAPMLVMTSGWMPPATYVVFTAVTSLVAAVEGATGIVPRLIAMFAMHAALWVAVSWVAAWALARATAPLSPGVRRALTIALVGAGLVAALGWDVYRTPFGRAPRGNAIEALT